jgi:hypothetical protein
MKHVNDFTSLESLTLQPLKVFLKKLRNDLCLHIYLNRSAKDEDKFIAHCAQFKNKRVLLVIAFEQPKVLEWLLEACARNLSGFHILVFDNSRSRDFRTNTEEACKKYGVPYLGLPINRGRHPNRSHGVAMTWVYRRVVKKLEPSWFGFLDHDMIPVRKIDLGVLSESKICYGVINAKAYYWTLWAGYCFYNYSQVKDLPMNFLHDFSRNLDTGGRNWDCLYSKLDKNALNLAYRSNADVCVDPETKFRVQLMDSDWIHIGGVSYNDTFQPREHFYERLVTELMNGRNFDDMVCKNS